MVGISGRGKVSRRLFSINLISFLFFSGRKGKGVRDRTLIDKNRTGFSTGVSTKPRSDFPIISLLEISFQFVRVEKR